MRGLHGDRGYRLTAELSTNHSWPDSNGLESTVAEVINLGLFCHFKSVIDLDSQVCDGTFKLPMTKQELDSSKILRPAIDQSDLGTPQRVRTVHRWVKANSRHPNFDYPSILPSG